MGYKLQLHLIFLLFFFPITLKAQLTFVKSGYVNRNFIQLLAQPSKQTSAMLTLKCNQKIRIYKSENTVDKKFYRVKVDKDWGLVEKIYISDRKVDCFAQQYPEFFQELVRKGIIEAKDFYFLGELNNEMEEAVVHPYD